MAGLTDMEELLGRVKAPDISGFLREALACYGAGAYRACIVLCFIALFEDLRQKTHALGRVNGTAKRVSTEIEKLAAGQKPFENQLVEQLQAVDLINELQGQRLKQIIVHRNKAAHPSGLAASAEEARFVYHETIERFLIHPVLSTTHAVDDIIQRLRSGNFFPSRRMEEIREIVASELAHVHSSAHPFLVSQLSSMVGDDDKTAETNSRFFLLGASISNQATWRPHIITHLVNPKCHDTKFWKAIIGTISVDPTIFADLGPAERIRVAALFGIAIDKVAELPKASSNLHPISISGALCRNLSDEQIYPDLNDFMSSVIAKFPGSEMLLRYIRNSKHTIELYSVNVIKKAASSDFGVANSMALALLNIDKTFADAIDEEVAFKVLNAIRLASMHGAYNSMDIVKNEFEGVPYLRSKAAQFAQDQREFAIEIAGGHTSEDDAVRFVDEVSIMEKSTPESDNDELPF